MSRYILSALLCTFGFAQSAFAIAPVSVAKRSSRELAALQSQDPNDDKTSAGMNYRVEKKKECPLASHKGDRDGNTNAKPEQVAAASGGRVNGTATAQ